MTPNTIPVVSPIQFMNPMISTGCWRNSVKVVITSADLVELQKRRDLVKGVLGGPVGEFVSQDLQHGRERENKPRWPEEGRVRPEFAVSQATRASRQKNRPKPSIP
jgi:hypothetical protein